jgi:3-hydroxybutyryl-CoA dehydrogenase
VDFVAAAVYSEGVVGVVLALRTLRQRLHFLPGGKENAMGFDGLTTAVIGAGTMGTGIAQCLADHGIPVTVFDVSQEVLKRSLQRMRANRHVLTQAGLLSPDAAGRSEGLVTTTSRLEEAVKDVGLVFEAVPEDLELKCDLFARLDELCDANVSFASNTSGLSITRLASATSRPERVAGMHWWNPAHLTPLVEVVSGERTDRRLVSQLIELARYLGKEPIHVRRDVPGFVGNRLQFAVMREALHLIEEGIASPEDVDTAMTHGPGLRWAFMGPLRTADLGGLDVFASICRYLWPDLSNAAEPPAALRERVQNGQLGAKRGRGFYTYDENQLADWTRRRDQFLIERLKASKERESEARA